jgi:molybdopterin adenylyltransferase
MANSKTDGKNGHAQHAEDHEHHGPEELHVGILTCSDRSARGERADTTGPTIHNLVVDLLKGEVAQYKVVPDNVEAISTTLIEWVDQLKLDLILTNGGTGLSPTDVTPEATRKVIEREVPWLVSGMVLESLRVTPYAMLTRATAGIRGSTLIVNLPGSPKAATENLTAVAEILPHAVMIVQGVDPALVRSQKKGESKPAPAPAPAPAGAVAKNVGGPTC